MPIHPSSIKPPARPVASTYTPPNGHKHKVTTGESWVSLAAGVGMGPWDLIRYNYPSLPLDTQTAAKEVNWYLQQYVGCTQTTPDNRNFSFSSGDSPGEVWLPNSASSVAPLTPDQKVTQIVLATLRDPAVRGMNFGVGRIFIPSSNYELVAKAIDGGYIKVKAEASFSNYAEYRGGPNQILVAPNITDLGLIIHECTHAVFDLRMIATRVEESEGLAYVAQALFGLVKYGPSGRYVVSPDPNDPVSWLSWQLIFDESTRLANIVRIKYRVTDDEATLLFTAVKGANFYRKRVGHAEQNDGLGDAYYQSL